MGLLAYVLGPSCLHTVSKFLSEIWFFIIHLNVTPHALPLKEIVLLGTSHESKNLGACMITSGSSLDFFFSFFEWVSDSERKDFIASLLEPKKQIASEMPICGACMLTTADWKGKEFLITLNYNITCVAIVSAIYFFYLLYFFSCKSGVANFKA